MLRRSLARRQMAIVVGRSITGQVIVGEQAGIIGRVRNRFIAQGTDRVVGSPLLRFFFGSPPSWWKGLLANLGSHLEAFAVVRTFFVKEIVSWRDSMLALRELL